jgi:NADPH-dependent curcumin reductase CurA
MPSKSSKRKQTSAIKTAKQKTASQAVALFRENAGSGVFRDFLWVVGSAQTDSSLVVCGVVKDYSAGKKNFLVVVMIQR